MQAPGQQLQIVFFGNANGTVQQASTDRRWRHQLRAAT